MTNLTREETVWLQAYIASIISKMCPSPETIAYSCLKHFKETFPTPTAEDNPAVNSVKGECELNRDFETYDNGVRAGIQLGREAMLSEVLEYLKSIKDDAGWYYADKVRAKFKGIEASEGKGKE